LDTDRLPERANQLWGFANDFQAVGYFKAWAKRNSLDSQFNTWPDDAVRDAVDDFLRAGRPEDAPRDDQRGNGQQPNGYAGANRRN